jgi:hypothetical protein
MQCLEIEDTAATVERDGKLPPKITQEAKDALRKFANGKMSRQEAAKAVGSTLRIHPPPWLRIERLSRRY